MSCSERTFITGSQRQSRSTRETELEKNVAQLEAKLASKDSIIADISDEYVAQEADVE